MHLYNFDQDQFIAGMNQSKEELVQTLLKDKVITIEQAQTINEKYALIATTPNLLGSVLSKILGRSTPDKLMVIAVRL